MMSNVPHHHYHYPQHPSTQWCEYEVIRGFSSLVQEKVDDIAQSSSFLKTQPDRPPCFDLCELGLGPILGSGAFSQVRAVTSFHLRHEIPTSGELPGSSYHKKLGLAEHARISGHGRAPYYAVKNLRPDLMGEDLESAAIDLCIEVEFLTRLNHPNIVKVRGLSRGGSNAFETRRDAFFVILDRLEPLDHRINRWRDRAYRYPDYRPVSLSRKMDYALQVANAIDYLHDRRIIFRDLKPSNVGFRADNPHSVQLFDFGLAREIPSAKTFCKDETFLMSSVGTRRYMAPEVHCTNCYNLKADVYSWSMLLVELLTLNKPYPHYSSEEHLEYVCKRGERPVLTRVGIPLVLQQLLEQAWAHDARLRLPMKAICHQLHSLCIYTDEELSHLPTEGLSTSLHSTQSEPAVSPTAEDSPVYFEFPPHFQHLVQDCDILSEYSDMDGSCMDLTLTTTASTTWQDSVSTFF